MFDTGDMSIGRMAAGSIGVIMVVGSGQLIPRSRLGDGADIGVRGRHHPLT